MPQKNTTKKSAAKAPAKKEKKPAYTTTARPAPVKTTRAQVAPHVKTLSNGQPRPKKRSK